MKSILLFFIITLFTTTLFAQIDERKTDVYFANGILTKSNDAENNTILLEDTIIAETYGGDVAEYKKHIAKVTTAYNSTHAMGVGDLIESLLQKLSLHEIVDTYIGDIYSILTQNAHSRDLSIQVDSYKKSIQSGHKVVVVAHSQGNLFTYEAYRKLDSWMQNYFEAVSVASPGHYPIKEIGVG